MVITQVLSHVIINCVSNKYYPEYKCQGKVAQKEKKKIKNILVVVVRYFGGTKLGVPGLIAAYKESAAAVLDAANIVERTVDTHIKIDFSYIVMNDVMRIIKEEQPTIDEQIFDNLCTIKLSIRNSKADIILGRLRKVEGAIVDIINEEQ